MPEFQSLPTLLIWPATFIVLMNFMFFRSKGSGKFERDAKGSSFKSTLTGSISILSNNDSVLRREHVKDSIDGYEKLFKGARKDVGTISSEESIRKRELEYKSMVNSFYDLVTDFYEWGWGQVRFFFSSLDSILSAIHSPVLRGISRLAVYHCYIQFIYCVLVAFLSFL